MHYGDPEQEKNFSLEIVVYIHGVCGAKEKRKKDGRWSIKCVDYQITSIRDCKFVSPFFLRRLMLNPYTLLAELLKDVPFESWIRLKILKEDDHKISEWEMELVDDHLDELMRLH